MTIRFGTCDQLGCEVARRAGAILHIDLLAKRLAHGRARNAGQDVARPAGGEPHHDPDRLGRIRALGMHRADHRDARRSCRQCETDAKAP